MKSTKFERKKIITVARLYGKKQRDNANVHQILYKLFTMCTIKGASTHTKLITL